MAVRDPNQWLERITPRLNNAWRGTWKPGTVEPGRYLYDHELVIVSKGNCRVQIGASFHELDAGSFLIVPPGCYHATLTGGPGVHRNCFHFDWLRSDPQHTQLPLWVYHPGRPRPALIKHAPEFVPDVILTGRFETRGSTLPLLETLFHHWMNGQKLDLALCHAILSELLLTLLWERPATQPIRDRTTRLAYAVKELLDQTPSGSDSIQTLLGSLGFSYAHLCRQFILKFGISPVRYRNAVRLERAKSLLRDPKCTIAEAAYAAGFSDPAYFSRKFRQSHGVAPSRSR